jgi:hypothetical protein
MIDLPDNQEAVQEMVAKNPLFKEQKWRDLWLDKLHPERVVERNARQAENWRALQERWKEIAQNRPPERPREGVTFTIPRTPVSPPRREVPVERLGQWVREIEADERLRMKSPTERRTMERSQEIQDHRRFLERDGRFRESIEDVRRLPNGRERQ